MSASNVYTVYKTATGQAINGRTRVCGLYFTHGAAGPSTVQFYDGDADTDPLLMTLSSTTVADSQNFVIPEQGILFQTGVYVKFGATITSITLLFEGGAAA
jgi:hypothetical protein